MVAILDRILRAGEGRALKQLEKIAEEVNSHESTFVAMSDDELRAMTEKFKARLENGEDLDDILPEAFAVVREASKRTLNLICASLVTRPRSWQARSNSSDL